MKRPTTVRVAAVLAGILCGGAALTAVTPAAGAVACRVNYTVTSQWQGGFVADVTLTNLGDALNGWTVTWSFPAGQTVASAWNATVSQSGATATATNVGWNGAVSTNGTTAFGFQGTSGSTNPVPASFAVNGVTCSGGTTPTTTAATTGTTTGTTTTRVSTTTTTTTTSTTSTTTTTSTTSTTSTTTTTGSGRRMESLGRGVVAVRSSAGVLVSWRLLGLDADGIGFNVYRSAAGAAAVKLNGSPLTGGTNYTDTTANLALANSYSVRPVVNGAEQAASGAFTLSANHAVEPVVRVPLRAGGAVKFLWVGDLDGDGEYDYVIDRQTSPQTLEAYRSNGTFLWSMNLGPNSTNQNNIEGGSSTVNVGHNDGVTVYDFDGNGRAEVAVRIANGVTFGNGVKFTASDDTRQYIAILDGLTGASKATAAVPTDYLSDGPMYARFGVGYLDGSTPSLVAYMKNRIGSGDFNLMYTAWKFTGSALTMQWKWLRGSQNAPDGHNTRILDVDGDGKDEIAEIGFVLNGDGKLRYSLASKGVVHGDRFHITKIDPNRAGLQGYGVQQDNPSGLREYYYDAANGNMIWQHVEAGTADVGRAVTGDIDPRHPGMEVWSFSGLYNAATNKLTQSDASLAPWPQMGLWWDGDTSMELLNNGKFEKWNPNSPTTSSSLPRLQTASRFGAVQASQGVNPTFYGDILGDWREEVVYTNATFDELIIFTTDQPSSTRLYSLAHNPEYRNAMTLKGYMQSNLVDYFLGSGMTTPPRPRISYLAR